MALRQGGCLPLLRPVPLRRILLGIISLGMVAATSSPVVPGAPCPSIFFPLPLLGCAVLCSVFNLYLYCC